MGRYFYCLVGYTLGGLLVLMGALTPQIIPDFFEKKFTIETENLDWYVAEAMTQHVKLYMFNVTNPDAIAANGSQPTLTKVGPYWIIERRRRGPIEANPDNSTNLDYKIMRTYHFEQNKSLPLDTLLTLPNVAAFSVALEAQEKVRHRGEAASKLIIAALGEYLKDESLYETHTAGDWLFNGVKLRWLDAMNEDGFHLELEPQENKFGLYYGRHNQTWLVKPEEIFPLKGSCNISTVVHSMECNISPLLRITYSDELQPISQAYGLNSVAAYFNSFLELDTDPNAVSRFVRRPRVNLNLGPTAGFNASKALRYPVVHPYIAIEQANIVDEQRTKELKAEVDSEVKRRQLNSVVAKCCFAAIVVGYSMMLVSICACIVLWLKQRLSLSANQRADSEEKAAQSS